MHEDTALQNTHTVTSDCNRVMVHRFVMPFTAMTGPHESRRRSPHSAACTGAARAHRRTPATYARSTRVPLRLERASILAINALAQPLARLEIRRVLGRKRHRRPGPGVVGDPRGAESDREAAEAPDLDCPPPARRAAICSNITRTASVTSRSTSWGCLCAMRWINSDFVIGPLSHPRALWGRSAAHGHG